MILKKGGGGIVSQLIYTPETTYSFSFHKSNYARVKLEARTTGLIK